MGRLIDESELIDIIQGSEELLDFQKDECIDCIKACNTAYDPDKVVWQLEDRSVLSRPVGWLKSYEIITLAEAIDIVKGGGANGN